MKQDFGEVVTQPRQGGDGGAAREREWESVKRLNKQERRLRWVETSLVEVSDLEDAVCKGMND